MSDSIQNFARDQLLAFIERIERLEEEKRTIADSIKDIYHEAKSGGFDIKVLKKLFPCVKRMNKNVWKKRPFWIPICVL
ncbi:hypothetical protein B488_05880 [Liberibacter crescens BT-1]|uniref:GapR-like DNA-binding domain-containing protein n=1 Tax=Liberibacter crescens (strain BT-1) TaxID=1215343 RepID=L0EUS0_LIBCB|nr:hypothetical protein B488_05880 [Liberibacter crescens BT-1]